MLTYILVAAVFIAVTTAIVIAILNRFVKLNISFAITIAIGSLLTGLVFPALYGWVSELFIKRTDNYYFVLTIALTVVLYLVLALILALIIAKVVFKGKPLTTPIEKSTDAQVEKSDFLTELYKHYTEYDAEKSRTVKEIVDREENIDKMGIDENYDIVDNDVIDENNDINSYIEKAFRQKENGDLEGAALSCIKILESQPGNELFFLTLLDICSIYKELGQKRLAHEILKGYAEVYGELMNPEVFREINRNLYT